MQWSNTSGHLSGPTAFCRKTPVAANRITPFSGDNNMREGPKKCQGHVCQTTSWTGCICYPVSKLATLVTTPCDTRYAIKLMETCDWLAKKICHSTLWFPLGGTLGLCSSPTTVHQSNTLGKQLQLALKLKKKSTWQDYQMKLVSVLRRNLWGIKLSL